MSNAVHARSHSQVQLKLEPNPKEPKKAPAKLERRYSLPKNTKTLDVITDLKKMGWTQKPQNGGSHVKVLTPNGNDHISIPVGGTAHRNVSPGMRHDIEALVNKVMEKKKKSATL